MGIVDWFTSLWGKKADDYLDYTYTADTKSSITIAVQPGQWYKGTVTTKLRSPRPLCHRTATHHRMWKARRSNESI